MRRHLVLATRLSGVLCSIVMLVTSYTPNHYYPVLRRLHPDRSPVSNARRQQIDPGSRLTQVSGPAPESPFISITGADGSTDIVGLRPRRLMGIFRCYGWGPGCSDVALPSSSYGQALGRQSTSGRIVKNSLSSSAISDQPSNHAGIKISLDPVKSRNGYEIDDNQGRLTPEAEADSYVQSSSISRSDSDEQTPTSSGAFRFQPFFTLTSEEDEIDNDQDGDRPLAVGTSTKRRDVLNFDKNTDVAVVTDFSADVTDTVPNS